MYRVRYASPPVDPHRKGLRAPAVHTGMRYRAGGVGSSRGDDRAAQSMAVWNKATVQ
jgi:hypothetical protein